MTADSLDLEDCNDMYKGLVGTLIVDDMNLTMLDLDNLPEPQKIEPVPCPISSFNDMKYQKLGYNDIMQPEIAFKFEDYLLPFDEPFPDVSVDCKMKSGDSDMSFQNCSVLDMEADFCLSTLVSPDLILPNSITSSSVVPDPIPPPTVKEENDEAVDSIWQEVSELSDIKLLSFVDGGCLGDELVSLDDIFKKKKRRKLTHLEFDHCYSQPPEEDTYFNKSLYSPASSTCSDKSKGVKRSRPSKKKAAKQVKIKQEIISSDEEVDVETPCSVSLIVPKITISLAPPVKTGPAKRGRKPKNKTEGQIVKKTTNRNCPVSPRDLQAAIKQQKQRCYITKSGRVSNKISNSVETTPSTSTPSSLSNSRCNSDNEDTVDKRASHNMAERNRRQELTNLFQNVRRKVPDIEKNLKASKVLILQSAASYIKNLERIDETKESQKQQLRAEIEKKLAFVQSLRNNRGCSS